MPSSVLALLMVARTPLLGSINAEAYQGNLRVYFDSGFLFLEVVLFIFCLQFFWNPSPCHSVPEPP